MSPESDYPIKESQTTDQKIKIAIVGGGISGCSCAYFLREIFADNAELVLFEKTNKIGGRLETTNFKGRDYELGGSILHSSNLYMKSFVKLFGLEARCDSKDSDDYTCFYDSSRVLIALNGSFFGLPDKIQMFKYFGFIQLIRFTRWIEKYLAKFTRIYKLQESGTTFKELKSLLTKLDPKLFDASQQSLKKTLEMDGFNYRIIDQLANVACLSNYGQSNEIDGFVGLVSICGTVGDLWSVKNGNKQVPIKLLETSGARVNLNTRIKSVTKSSMNPNSKNTIVYQTENDEPITDESFDYVIIAFPLFDGVIGTDLKLDFECQKEFSDYHMQRTNTYMINGKARIFPDLPMNKRLQLHCVDPNVRHRCVSVQLPCDYDQVKDSKLFLDNGPKLFKIFAEVDLDSSDFDKIFEEGYEVVKEMPWLAYPKYLENPSSKSIPDIVLDGDERERVYYLNSMEWSSSCMEISCIAARNAALLIAGKEKSLVDGKKPRKFFNKNGLKEVLAGIESNFIFHGVCAILACVSVVVFGFAAYMEKQILH